jgi:hypothetical protein
MILRAMRLPVCRAINAIIINGQRVPATVRDGTLHVE